MKEAFETSEIRGVLHRPEQANGDAIALTHGAGSNCEAALLVRLAEEFANRGYLVLRYDLPFRRLRAGGSPMPSGAAKDREGVASAVAALRQMTGGRIYAAGHSYGGRQSAMAASERPEMASGLLLLSYPLHPPQRPEQKRTSYFPDLRTPALFVHGTKDPFGSLEELRKALTLIPARTDLLVVDRAGHDLKKAGTLAGEILEKLRAVVSATK
ncbi:MAG TPA: alpha/beta fold hydrolase [Bryobacteraceae bacterium]|nr:alpha/beta fold hydrolase [Bryobacteraceae bacterium]